MAADGQHCAAYGGESALKWPMPRGFSMLIRAGVKTIHGSTSRVFVFRISPRSIFVGQALRF
jgi:hypothetical protein